MPQLAKYKTAGRIARSLQKSIGDTNKLQLGLEYRQWEGEEERNLYGNIGATAANIVGIVKEKKMLTELNKLKESAGNLPGVVKESQSYQRGGKIGELFGLGKGSRDVYKSAFTGEEISDTTMYGIGKAEALKPGSTMYGDYKEVLNKGVIYSPQAAEMATQEAYSQVGATTQEEYDRLTDVALFEEEEQFPITESSGPYTTATETKTTDFKPPEPPSIEDDIMTSFSDDNESILSEPTIKNYFGLEGGNKQLSVIIANQEGFYKKGSLPRKLNNPGAIKDTETGKLREFKTLKEGFGALTNQLDLYAQGKSTSGITPDFTISQFVDMYVAGGETEDYENKYPGELNSYKESIMKGIR